MNRPALLALAAAMCISLSSCRTENPQGGDSSAPAQVSPALTRYELPGEGARELTLEHRWVLTLEDDPHPDDCSQTTSLVCRDLETGAMETWISLYYNPCGVEEDDILLYPFADILGCGGVVLLSRAEHPQRNTPVTRCFRQEGGCPELIAECEGALYTARADGFDILLSVYPFGYDGSRGGAALYWQEDGKIFCRPLRDAVEHFLGLSWPASVSMSLEVREESGTLAVCWQGDDSPEHTMELDLSDLLAYARSKAARTQEVQLGCLNGDELLKLVLEERRLETEYSWNVFEVEKINVYRGESLVETLLPRNWGEKAYFGKLFDTESEFGMDNRWGEPLVQDLNGDGVSEFGLICLDNPARNLPYLYFLWNAETEEYVPLAVLCASPEADPETGQLVEKVNEGNGVTTTNWYEFDDAGGLTLVRSETETWDGTE